MFLKFHQLANDRLTMVSQHNVLYVQDHDAGGASIFTNIPTTDPKKNKIFRSKETTAELYKSSKIDLRLSDGLFSTL